MKFKVLTILLLSFSVKAAFKGDLVKGISPSTGSAKKQNNPDPLNPDYNLSPLQEWEKKFKDFQFLVYKKDGHTLPYRLHKPASSKKQKKYPLVLFMHGAGERGLDNRHQFYRFRTLPFWQDIPCYVLAPQCPSEKVMNDGSDVWVDTPFNGKSHSMKANPTWPLQLTMELLDKVVKENNIDRDRIYITGLSMGGFATWEMLQRESKFFAGAIPVCGGADLAFAKRLSKTPLWVFHGDKDDIVVPERSRDIVAAIKQAGGIPKYTELKGVGHGAWDHVYNKPEVWEWLFAQRK